MTTGSIWVVKTKKTKRKSIPKTELRTIPLAKLRMLKRNPQYQTEAQQDALQRAIEKDGFLAPILVRPLEDDQFEIVSGNHRYLALKALGVTEVPCVVADLDADSIARVAINLNTIHGNPLPEQLAPFLASYSDEALRGVYLENDLAEAVYRFDEELRERLENLEMPEALNTSTPNADKKSSCVCKCGHRHFIK